ncbi:MAG: hypothetical protein RL385_2752 [Pseudomonadota bacterium]|jgi:hypothetical protein
MAPAPGTLTANAPSVRKILLPLLLAVLCLSGVAVAADAWVTTDEEELDAFLSEVSARSLDGRLDGALSHADPGAVSCKLVIDGRPRVYSTGDSAALGDALREALGVFDSSEQKLLQHATRIDGDHASVTARMGDGTYEQTVIYDLVHKQERWLLRAIRVL